MLLLGIPFCTDHSGYIPDDLEILPDPPAFYMFLHRLRNGYTAPDPLDTEIQKPAGTVNKQLQEDRYTYKKDGK